MAEPLRDSQLHLLWTSRMEFAKDQWVKPHSHRNFCQLFLFLAGEGRMNYGEHEVPLQPGHFYFVNRGQSHSFRIMRKSMTLDFKFRLLDADLERRLASRQRFYGPCPSSGMNGLKHCFKLTLANRSRPDPLLPCMIDASFKLALLSIAYRAESAETGGMAATEPDDLSDFPPVRYIREHYAEPLTVNGMARELGFHPNYLIKLCKQKIGMTPIAYLQQWRLEKACEAMEFGDGSIEQIAESVGLTLPYFSKLFRTRMGVSPVGYRKLLRNAVNVDIVLEESFRNE